MTRVGMNHPLAQYSTATISDGLDRLGRPGSLHGLGALAPGAKLFGRAFTVRYVAAGHPPGTVGDYLDDVKPGDVVVIDNGGRTDCTVWGDILTSMADDRGVGGTVIDGVCRDSSRAIAINYPLFTRGRFMRTGKDRVEVSDVQRPVGISGVQVRPGQLVVGDEDGVVTVPADVEDRLIDTCERIHTSEGQIVSDVLRGCSLAEARATQGYHLLQRKEDSR